MSRKTVLYFLEKKTLSGGKIPFGENPFGARRAGPPLPCVERKYWKSSEEKVSLKTILYFLRKITFLVILPIKSLWDLSKTTDLVERIRMQFFLSKIDRRTLELWHFFFQSFIDPSGMPFWVCPFGARRAGPPLPCVERKYWKSSQGKVSRETILYFLEK